jgi:hypothetical protein
MSKFDASNSNIPVEVDSLELYEWPIDSLPDFITESSLFIMTQDICPGETVFPFLTSKMVLTLDIHSHEDLEKLIEAEQMFGFTSKTQKQILKNVYNFWLDDPSSSQLQLPIKDFSHFGNQVRVLLSDSDAIIPITCFKCNYLELFDYILERDGLHTVDSGRFPDYTLPYYGVANNHIEIVRRGLEVGVSVAKDCIDSSIKEKNLEMFKLLREYKVKYTANTLELAASLGLPEMYEYFLKVAINNNMMKKFLVESLKNKYNLEFLLHRSGTDLTTFGINGEEILITCLKEAYSVEIIQMVDMYFTKQSKQTSDGITLLNKIQERAIYSNIVEKVINKDDLELFTYLQSKGFLINENLINYASQAYKPKRLTPGYLKRQLAEQNVAIQRKIHEEENTLKLQID